MTEEELIQAIKDAYDTMKTERVDCPWCNGHIGWEDEYHNEWCIWLKVKNCQLNAAAK